MQARVTRSIAAAALVALAGTVVAGLLAPARSQTTSTRRIVFATPFKDIHGAQLDLGARGPSGGDVNTTVAPLLHAGKRVGLDRDTCTLIRPRAKVFLCHGVFRLGTGSIVFEGLANFKTCVGRHSITGGTGDFRTARGTARASCTKRALHWELHVVM